jgi:hypothetical protein
MSPTIRAVIVLTGGLLGIGLLLESGAEALQRNIDIPPHAWVETGILFLLCLILVWSSVYELRTRWKSRNSL